MRLRFFAYFGFSRKMQLIDTERVVQIKCGEMPHLKCVMH